MEKRAGTRERLVRDYSTSTVFAQDSRQRFVPPLPVVHNGWDGPSRNSHDIPPVEPRTPTLHEDHQLTDHETDELEGSEKDKSSSCTLPAPNSITSRSRLADFFGQEIFQIVLHNPTTAHQLRKYAQTRLCGENLEFLEKLDQYHHALSQVTQTVVDIHRGFMSANAPSQVNLPEDIQAQVNKNLKNVLGKVMPTMESMFMSAQHEIERLVALEIYPRFVRHQITTSAAQALATNKNKYGGLGDCFVLTDPRKADNPIVYASDGFVKVTGYNRNEIIPRNCRFLQMDQTDKQSVTRIKKSLQNEREHVELLLNQRKSGEPFWNLLYTAPLYDSAGKLSFFLGGQINVSTTVHNTSDILQILSYGGEEESAPIPSTPKRKTRRQSIFGKLMKPKPLPTYPVGMENDLLADLNDMSFTQQKEAFYTAYSKYLVIAADSMTISFASFSISAMLFSPHVPKAQNQIVGVDVFKFLSQHAPGQLSRDYKSHVMTAIKSGQPISLELSLSTRRTSDLEKFLTHWTPLKNDVDAVGFVVLTLGSHADVR